MSRFFNHVLDLHGVTVYLIVGLVVFAEDALFIGFVLPGETLAILGGVAASRGNASVVLMCAVVVVAAIAGDSVGYEIGARYGTRLLSMKVLRRRRERIDAVRATLARRAGPAVFIGRYVAFLRAVTPFLAGVSHMHYPRFLAFNAAGGITWGIGSVLLGYLAGNSYAAIERTFGRDAAIGLAVVVVIGAGVRSYRRHRRHLSPPPDTDQPDRTEDDRSEDDRSDDDRSDDRAWRDPDRPDGDDRAQRRGDRSDGHEDDA